MSVCQTPLSNSSSSKSQRLFEDEQQFIAPGIQNIALLSKLTIDRGEGPRLIDMDGKSYLDFNAGVSVASLGYNHPKYQADLKAQIDKLTVSTFTSVARLKLLKLLAGITPEGLNRIQLFSGGAEAVEAALRLARSYTKKDHVVGFWGGYHGKTKGVLALSEVDWKHEVGPLPMGFHQAPYPDFYLNALPGESAETMMARCLDHLKKQLNAEVKGQVAAVIMEPIQGTSGNIVPPKGWVKEVCEIAHQAGALFIADEMITGFGRTGHLFGVNYDSAIPDIMTCGKGFGNGFPVTAVIAKDEIAKAEPWSKPSAASSSYGGNPLASAAALSSVSIIRDENLTENSAKVGAVLLKEAQKLEEKYPFVMNARGRGLMVGFDLVKDKKTKQLADKEFCKKIFLEGIARGFIAMTYTPRARLHPPLIITESDAKEAGSILDEVFSKL